LTLGENGTRHYQGYCEFPKQYRISGLKKIHQEWHWEKRAGTRDQARDYCRKVGDPTFVSGPYEVGQWRDVAQGKRTDLDDAAKAIIDGRSMKEVADLHPTVLVKYASGLSKLYSFHGMTRENPPEVFILYGPSGCGKSRMAGVGQPGVWTDPVGDNQWFDGYYGQKDGVLDDFDGRRSHMTLKTLLRLLDRYKLQVPIKGGYTWWNPERIFITTNYHPQDWYDWADRRPQYLALARRVTRVYHWRNDWDEVQGTEEEDPIIIDRMGRPEVWKTWWSGPKPARPRTLGPLDLWIEGTDADDPFDFITRESESAGRFRPDAMELSTEYGGSVDESSI